MVSPREICLIESMLKDLVNHDQMQHFIFDVLMEM